MNRKEGLEGIDYKGYSWLDDSEIDAALKKLAKAIAHGKSPCNV